MKKISLILNIVTLFYFKEMNAQVISTIAGNPSAFQTPSCYNGSALLGSIGRPYSVCVDLSGNVYFLDMQHSCVERLDVTTGLISNIADGFSFPQGIALDSIGNVFVADMSNKIYKITPQGTKSIYAGNGASIDSGDNGPAINASIHEPNNVWVDAHGDLFISSILTIRKVSRATGIITTVVGKHATNFSVFSGNGINADSANVRPIGVATDSIGNIYIASHYMRILKVDRLTGLIHTVAGNGNSSFTGDGGLAINATTYPISLFVHTNGDIYYPDAGSGAGNTLRVRKIDALTGIIHTVVGSLTNCTQDGSPAITACITASSVCLDKYKNLYISDAGSSNRIRFVGTTIGIVDNSLPKRIVIYPNPTNNKLHFQNLDINSKTYLLVENILGEMVMQDELTENEISVANLKPALYFIKIRNEAGMSIGRFFKE